MNCYVCADQGKERPAVALCRLCLVGLCPTHLAEAQRPGPGGLQLGCAHLEDARADRRRRGATVGAARVAGQT